MKDPVPGRNDLRILLQLKGLAEHPWLITRDAHFLAYRGLIQERLGVEILDTRELPLRLEEWRHG